MRKFQNKGVAWCGVARGTDDGEGGGERGSGSDAWRGDSLTRVGAG